MSAVDRLLGRAWKEAEELGDAFVHGDHFLLALLRPGDDSLAAQALRACGLTHVAYAEALAAVEPRSEQQEDSEGRAEIAPTAGTYTIMGLAEGLSAGLGVSEAQPEHVLLAIIWEPLTPTTSALERLDTTREEIVDRLGDLGVPLPRVGLPPLEKRRWGETVVVPIEQLRTMLAELPGLFPPGTLFAFNHDDREAWLDASEEVDLPSYVAFALEAWERGRLPCPCCHYVTLDLDVALGERRCDVCYWIDDPVQVSDWTYRGGTNGISLVEAWENFARFGVAQEKYTDKVRPPRPDEIPPWRSEDG